MFARALFGLLLLAAACAEEDPSSRRFAGTWVMDLGPRTFMVLTLEEDGDRFRGTLSRPGHIETSDGVRFSHISRRVQSEGIVSASIHDAHLRFVTENPDDKQDRTEYHMTLTGENEAAIQLVEAPFEAWSFHRSLGAEPPSVSTDWDPQRSYSQEDSAVSSAEMLRIYEEDQAARQEPGSISAQEWAIIGRQDAERRSQTSKLLADGQLQTGEDFARAAFIFQHGSTSNDYLLAHTLAMIAVARGEESALWIGTATLDRYLQSIGKPQIYGTQFKPTPDRTATQEPYDRDLILDSLRRQLGVPSLAAQQDQLEHFSEQFESAAAAEGHVPPKER